VKHVIVFTFVLFLFSCESIPDDVSDLPPFLVETDIIEDDEEINETGLALESEEEIAEADQIEEMTLDELQAEEIEIAELPPEELIPEEQPPEEIASDEQSQVEQPLAEQPQIAQTPDVIETPVDQPPLEITQVEQPSAAQTPSVEPAPVQRSQAERPQLPQVPEVTQGRPMPPGRSPLQPPIQVPSQPQQTTPAQTPQGQSSPVQTPAQRDTASSAPGAEPNRISAPPPSASTMSPASTLPPAAPVRENLSALAPDSSDIIFSRTVRAAVGQLVEIPFTGNGWTYLGEVTSKRGVTYSSRRNDPEGQTYVFRAEETGTYALKFYKENFVAGYIINDYVQIIVNENPDAGASWPNFPIDRGRVTAQPRWPSALEEAGIQRGSVVSPRSTVSNAEVFAAPTTSAGSSAVNAAPAQSSTPPSQAAPQQHSTVPNTSQGTAFAANAAPSTQTTTPAQSAAQSASNAPYAGSSSIPGIIPQAGTQAPDSVGGSAAERQEAVSPEVVLQRAKDAFDAGNAADAIALLDQLKDYYPGGTDELYWYYGQFYEANTPSRNILLSLDYYRRLVSEFPQSSRLNDARRRIAYLERYYINIQ
jgi:hypothetical protein